MAPQTKEQKMAQKAFEIVDSSRKQDADYKSFALSFPSLIHSCGLAQALAFAQAKAKQDYLDDLQKVFAQIDSGELINMSKESELVEYTRITRHALMAATWLKRYCQATEAREA